MNAKPYKAPKPATARERHLQEVMAKNFPTAQVIAKSNAKVLVWFPEQEDVYLYDRTDEMMYSNIPGRPLLNIHRSDCDQETFLETCKKLV